MLADCEGFLYPTINDEICTNCGLCLVACPVVKQETVDNAFNNEVYACWSKNTDLRLMSSSGGVFSELAKQVFKNSGYVAGVSFSNCFKEAEHIIIETEQTLDKLRRSKLLQSNKKNIYRRIKCLLTNSHVVLFTGTPCEAAGLKAYLGADPPNLITCDLICGCVASPKVYKKYIDFLERKYSSSVISVSFKTKAKAGKSAVFQ